MEIEAIAGRIRDHIAGTALESSVKFDCGEDGVIVIDGANISTENTDAACTISIAKDDLEAMIAGELDPTAAFMQGKLKVDGDMALAMQLSQVL